MSRKGMMCPKCGKTMALVAAGWYCTKGDVLIDPVTGRPVAFLAPFRLLA